MNVDVSYFPLQSPSGFNKNWKKAVRPEGERCESTRRQAACGNAKASGAAENRVSLNQGGQTPARKEVARVVRHGAGRGSTSASPARGAPVPTG